jgi:hypothetical protein
MKTNRLVLIILVNLFVNSALAQSNNSNNPDLQKWVINLDFNKTKGSFSTMFKECIGAGRANEGELTAFVATAEAKKILTAMRSHTLGKDSVIIGEVTSDHPGTVIMKTHIGGTRVVDMLSGEQLPRIC